MTMKNDATIEEKLTCRFKIGMKNLKNFNPSTGKFQNSSLYWASFEQSINCLT